MARDEKIRSRRRPGVSGGFVTRDRWPSLVAFCGLALLALLAGCGGDDLFLPGEIPIPPPTAGPTATPS
jgi:hypothetical protein